MLLLHLIVDYDPVFCGLMAHQRGFEFDLNMSLCLVAMQAFNSFV